MRTLRTQRSRRGKKQINKLHTHLLHIYKNKTAAHPLDLGEREEEGDIQKMKKLQGSSH
jgi:hypothetical protein